MKVNKIFISIAFLLVAIIVLIVIKNINSTKQYSFFDEIDRMNIASIEVLEITTNKSVVSSDIDFIRQVTSLLSDLELDEVTQTIIKSDKYYQIYISEVGYYPHPAIGVSEGLIEHNGKAQYLSAEKSTKLINLLEDEMNK